MYERSITLNKIFRTGLAKMKRRFSFFYLTLIFFVSQDASGEFHSEDLRIKIVSSSPVDQINQKIARLEERKKKHVKNRKRHQTAARMGEFNSDLSLEVKLEHALAKLEEDQIHSLERQIRKLKEAMENQEK